VRNEHFKFHKADIIQARWKNFYMILQQIYLGNFKLRTKVYLFT